MSSSGSVPGRDRVVTELLLVILAPVLCIFASGIPGGGSSGSGGKTPPSVPGCTVAIAGQGMPGDGIRLTVMMQSCAPGRIDRLHVSVNGKDTGELPARTGANATFAGTPGYDTVVVTAAYAGGTENVVYRNPGL